MAPNAADRRDRRPFSLICAKAARGRYWIFVVAVFAIIILASISVGIYFAIASTAITIGFTMETIVSSENFTLLAFPTDLKELISNELGKNWEQDCVDIEGESFAMEFEGSPSSTKFIVSANCSSETHSIVALLPRAQEGSSFVMTAHTSHQEPVAPCNVTDASMRLRAVTFNVFNFQEDWESRFGAILRLLDSSDAPDVVFFQEMRVSASGENAHIRMVQSQFRGRFHFFFETAFLYSTDSVPEFEREGLAILVRSDRFDVVKTESAALRRRIGDRRDQNQRIMLGQRIVARNAGEMCSVAFDLATTHWALSKEAQLNNANDAVKFLEDFENSGSLPAARATIVGGDFNAQPHDESMLGFLRSSNLIDLWRNTSPEDLEKCSTNFFGGIPYSVTKSGFTWSLDLGTDPVSRIDYLLGKSANGSEKELGLFCVMLIGTNELSDHRGVAAAVANDAV